MEMTGNTVLITGGGSGIGRGLAETLHAEGNRVIIAGRREEALAETVAANPGMQYLQLDVEDANAIREFAARITGEFPALNVLINNAGIMRRENLAAPTDGLSDMEATVTTNLLGPIRLTAALLPHLQKQAKATIINVTSGLAFVPLALTPTYCATKAALHSYTQSLRFQLRHTNIQVIELIPPAVATELIPGYSSDPTRMPLDEYIAESIRLLKTQPEATEICVERVRAMRYAAENGQYDAVYDRLNQMTS